MFKKTEGNAMRQGGGTGKLLLVIMLVLAVIVSGCSKQPTDTGKEEATPGQKETSKQEATPSPEKPKEEPVTLQAFFPGDKPVGFDEVLTAVNDKLQTDGLGIGLNISWIPWSDYGNTVLLKATAGEDFDMFLDAPWLHMDKMITDGQIVALDDFIQQSPNLLKTIPQQMWDANKFQGKIYGIPMGVVQGYVHGFLVRKDLREKYGLPPIKTLEDMESFLYAVKKNETKILPIAVNGGIESSVLQSKFIKMRFTETSRAMTNADFIQFAEHFLYYPNTDNPKIAAFWEQPGFTDFLKQMRKYYQDGIFEKNALVQKDAVALFNAGKFASVFYSSDGISGIRSLPLLTTVPGAQLEVVVPYDTENPKPISDYSQPNFLVVNKNSKAPEKVVQLAEWLSIQENHDLLQFGLPGKDWNPVGEDQYQIVEGSKYLFPGYVLTWRPGIVNRYPDNILPDDKKWLDYAANADNFTKSIYVGFKIDTEPFKTELTKLQAVKDEYLNPLDLGVVDPETGLAMLQKAYKNAGIDKVIAEVQKQVDEFLKK